MDGMITMLALTLKISIDVILYFVWEEDQSDAAYCIFHTVLISCITVLYLPNCAVFPQLNT